MALLALGPERLLIAALDGTRPSLDAVVVGRALAMCRGSPTTPCTSAVAEATRSVQTWCTEWSGRRRLSVASASGARVRLQIAGRISSLLAAAPRHQRALLVPLTSQAQQALRSPLGAGAERTLLALSRATEGNVEWLEQIAALSKRHAPRTRAATEPALVVLILLRRSRGECACE